MKASQQLYDSMEDLDLVEPDGGDDENSGDEPEAWMETIWELEEEAAM